MRRAAILIRGAGRELAYEHRNQVREGAAGGHLDQAQAAEEQQVGGRGKHDLAHLRTRGPAGKSPPSAGHRGWARGSGSRWQVGWGQRRPSLDRVAVCWEPGRRGGTPVGSKGGNWSKSGYGMWEWSGHWGATEGWSEGHQAWPGPACHGAAPQTRPETPQPVRKSCLTQQ